MDDDANDVDNGRPAAVVPSSIQELIDDTTDDEVTVCVPSDDHVVVVPVA
jgi:hypothetical protein